MKARLALLLVALLLALPAASLAGQESPEGAHGSDEATAEHGGSAEAGEHESDLAATIFKWIHFVVVFGGLGYLLRKPMKEFFTGQRAAILAAITEARQARQQAEQRLAEIEQRLSRLEQEVEALRREAVENATTEQQRIRDSARREAERIAATAQAEIESTARAARLELRAYAARLAVTLAEQRLRQQLTPESHAALLEAFAHGLREGRV